MRIVWEYFVWTGSLSRTNTGHEKLIIRGFNLCQGTRRRPADSTEVQNVITIHDQGNGISILNVWGSVCENMLFRAQILPFWFKSPYAWTECPGPWNFTEERPSEDKARAWADQNITSLCMTRAEEFNCWETKRGQARAWVDQQSISYSVDRVARAEEFYSWVTKRGQARAWSDQHSISYSEDRVARAEEFYCWVTKRGQDQGLGRSTYYFLLCGQVEQVM